MLSGFSPARACRRAAAAASILGAAAFVGPAATSAQAGYPDKPITFVVPFAAGTATDQQARATAQGITQATGIPVVIDNRPGAQGFLAAQAVARAAPDGYTVLISTNTTHAANEHLFKKLPYDPEKDFEPVTALNKGNQVMIVRNTLPAHSVREFIDLAKKAPGKYTFGASSASSRMAVELFQAMAGIQLLHVPYKSTPAAITDLISGRIDLMIVDAPNAMPQVKTGSVRGLAVSAATRSSLAPELPTIAEAALPGYDMTYWTAAHLPAGTPPAIVDKLNALMVQSSLAPASVQFYENTGSTRFTTTPQGMREFQHAESAKWGEIIRAAHIEQE